MFWHSFTFKKNAFGILWQNEGQPSVYQLVTCGEVKLIVMWMCMLACSVTSVVSDAAIPWIVAHQAPLSMGILRARILEWVATPSSRESFKHRDQTQVSHIAGGFFTIWAIREAPDNHSKFTEWSELWVVNKEETFFFFSDCAHGLQVLRGWASATEVKAWNPSH